MKKILAMILLVSMFMIGIGSELEMATDREKEPKPFSLINEDKI